MDQIEKASIIASKAEKLINEKGFNIFKPQLMYIMCMVLSGEEKKISIQKAKELVIELGLKPALWKIQLEYAKILKENGELEAASCKEKEARATIDFIKININDKKIVELYDRYTIQTISTI